MNALPLLVLSVVVGAPQDVVLYDFSATWCGPCQQVKPTVQRLEQDGYPVQAVDVDQQRQLAAQYGVSAIPCFVMVVDGREVSRVQGLQSYEQLRSMFAAVGYAPGQQPVEGGGPDATAPARVLPASATGPLSPSQQALAASVRLKVEDAEGNSYGTGTIVDEHGDEALVATCGHIFRESEGKGTITVDLFLDGAVESVPGQLISYDLKSDVGLVAIRPSRPVEAVEIAAAGSIIRPGQNVFSIGCNRGDEPSLQHSHVTTVDRYQAPPNVQVAGRPVEGRSGGGLFNSDGQLIGICNADIAEDNEGYFAALATIQSELDRNNLAFAYQSESESAGQGTGPIQLATHEEPAVGQEWPPDMPGRMPPTGQEGGLAAGAVGQALPTSVTPTAAVEDAVIDDTEVICIVRSKGQPRGSGECYVLEQPSAEFLDQLNREFRTQLGQTPTILRLQR